MPGIVEDSVISVGMQSNSSVRMSIASPYLYKMQKKHFIYCNMLPFIGVIAAVILAFYHPLGWPEISVFFTMWLLTGLGITVGFHRLLCHRSFKTKKPVRALLAILGCMAAQGPVISWVAMHRRHHQIADLEGDVHSPNLHGSRFFKLKGFLHAHLLWMLKHDYPNVTHYAKDLLKEPETIKISRYYFVWVVLGVVIPAILVGLIYQSLYGFVAGALWGGAVRLFVVGHLIASLNSFLHLWGTQSYVLNSNHNDNSRNNWLLGILAWGEGWHNNHHAFPYSASFGLAWYRIDFGYWFIVLLKKAGLAWDVKIPRKDKIKNTEVNGVVAIN